MPFRARDVEHVFKQRNTDAAAKYCLQRIADEQSALRQMIMECASAIDQLADLATTAAMVAGAAKPDPDDRSNRKPLVSAMERAMGRDIDAPEVNPHDQHGDEGAPTDPDKMRDD